MFGSGSFNECSFEDFLSIAFDKVTVLGGSLLTGVPTSFHKSILANTNRRIIFAAEISPWTVSDRNS